MIAEAPARPATPTERKVAEMLLENTGSAMMDSGGIYGRAWQTTRAKYGLDGGLPNSAFHGGPGHAPLPVTKDDTERVALIMRDEPSVQWDGYSISVDTFHFLVDALDYDPKLDAKYQLWQRVTNFGKDRWDKDWGLSLMERFTDQLAAKGSKVTGIYGDGGPVTENSYNGECALDRTIQITLFSIETPYPDGDYDESGKWIDPPYDPFLPDGSYVILQIHGGADVRGGYTDPVLFSESGMGEYAILDWARVYLRCEGKPEIEGQIKLDGTEAHQYDSSHQWDSENGGYTFNLDGMWGQGETVLGFDDYSVEKGGLKVIVDEEEKVLRCPIEGCGAILR